MRDAVKQALVEFYSRTHFTLEKSLVDPGISVGSGDFFSQSEAARYQFYSYIPALVGFERWAGRDVLEIGTGLGVDHARFARAGAQLAGVDLTPLHLEVTTERLRREGLTSRLVRADAETLPFRDASFDHVYSCGVLFLIPEIQRAVDEIYRVLRPGGEVLVMLYHKNSFHYYLKTLAFTGMIWGDLLYLSRQKLIDWSADGYNYPIIRLYSRGQARRLFSRFACVDMTLRTLTRAEFPVIAHLLPVDFLEFLSRWFGYYLFVWARK